MNPLEVHVGPCPTDEKKLQKGGFVGEFTQGVKGRVAINYNETIHIDGRIFYNAVFYVINEDGKEYPHSNVLWELSVGFKALPLSEDSKDRQRFKGVSE